MNQKEKDRISSLNTDFSHNGSQAVPQFCLFSVFHPSMQEKDENGTVDI